MSVADAWSYHIVDLEFPDSESFAKNKDVLLETAAIPGVRAHRDVRQIEGYRNLEKDEHVSSVTYDIDGTLPFVLALMKFKEGLSE